MSLTCPDGHRSEALDYCDVCGVPMPAAPDPPAAPGAAAAGSDPAAATPDPAAAGSGPVSAATSPAGVPDPALAAAGATGPGPAAGSPSVGQLCPECGAVSVEDALFCEGCGFDFTTRVPGRGPDPVPAAPDPVAPPAPPSGTVEWVAEVWVDPAWLAVQETAHPAPSGGPPTVVPLRGRTLLIGRPSASRNITPDIDCSTDPGVSRRHAQLTTDGVRWFVEDLDSANGSFVGPAAGPLPEDPVPRSTRVELGDDDRLYLGAWTRIVVRRATATERTR